MNERTGSGGRDVSSESILDRMRSAVSVELYMILMCLASNMNYPSQQGLIYERVCRDQYPWVYNISHKCDNLTSHQDSEVKKMVSYWNLILNVLFYSPQLVTLVLCGNLGSRLNLKGLLPIPPLFCLLATIVYLLFALFDTWPIWPLMIGNLLQGMGGGYLCSFALGYSYLALKSSQAGRTANISKGEACGSLGLLLGLVGCGPIIDNFGFSYVWIINAALYFFCIIYAIVWVPSLTNVTLLRESATYTRLQESPELATCCSGTCNLNSNCRSLQLCFGPTRDPTKAIIVVLLGLIVVLCDLSGVAEASVSYLYTKSDPINLSQSDYSYFMGAKTLAGCVGSLIILPLSSSYLPFSDLFYAIVGMCLRAAMELYTGFCRTQFMLFFVPLFALLASMVAPSCRSVISKTVAPHQVSSVFSLLALAECIINIGGGSFFSAIYPSTIEWFSGFSYIILAALLLIGLLVLIGLKLKFTTHQFGSDSSGDWSLDSSSLEIDDVHAHDIIT